MNHKLVKILFLIALPVGISHAVTVETAGVMINTDGVPGLEVSLSTTSNRFQTAVDGVFVNDTGDFIIDGDNGDFKLALKNKNVIINGDYSRVILMGYINELIISGDGNHVTIAEDVSRISATGDNNIVNSSGNVDYINTGDGNKLRSSMLSSLNK